MFTPTAEILSRIRALESLERVQSRDGERFRKLVGGEWWPSATTILKAMPQPWMGNWSARVERELVAQVAGEQHAALKGRAMRPANFSELVTLKAGKPYAHERARDTAANIGTEAHDMIEWGIRRELGDTFTPEPALGEPAKRSYEHWRNWRRGLGTAPIAVEQDVYHQAHRYTGGVDWIGYDSEGLIANDWKSGKALYAENHLQLASYIMAYRSMGIPVRTGWIVRVPRAEGEPDFEAVEVGHMAAGRVYTIEELFEVFLHVKATWDWLHHRNKPAVTGRTAKKVAAAGNGAEGEMAAAVPGARGKALPAAENKGEPASTTTLANGGPGGAQRSSPNDVTATHDNGTAVLSISEAAGWIGERDRLLRAAGITLAREQRAKVLEVLGLERFEGRMTDVQCKEFCQKFSPSVEPQAVAAKEMKGAKRRRKKESAA